MPVPPWQSLSPAALPRICLLRLSRRRQPAGQAPAQTPRGQQAPAQAARAQAPVQRTTLKPAQQQQGNADRQIAEILFIDAHGEVEMGKLAEQNATSAVVKELAQHMVRDHSKTEQTLRQFLGNAEEASPQEQQAQNRQAGNLDIVAVKKQIAQECAAWQKKELSEKRGQEFDSCFTGQQLAKHMEVICAERVLREYASPQLQQAIDQDLQAAEHHYRMAREAMQQLKGESGESGQTAPVGRSNSRARLAAVRKFQALAAATPQFHVNSVQVARLPRGLLHGNYLSG